MDETGTPVGFVLCWTSGFIKDVAVHQDWRGRGLGTALLLQAMRRLSSRGLRKVALKVVEENAVARRLYARHGFTATDSD
jgi:ribosomal protein S18 acetylase RimI-like enzyme